MDAVSMQTKLSLYLQQLAAVDAQLATSPGNAQLLELKGSITEMVDLTREMLGMPKMVAPAPTPPPAAPAAGGGGAGKGAVANGLGELAVGSYVSALMPSKGKYMNAIVTEVPVNGVATVMFLGFATTSQVATDSLQKPAFLHPVDLEKVQRVDGTVEGIYSGDGLWYTAKLTGIDKDGRYAVTYTLYGNSESLDIRHIRLDPATAPAKAAGGKEGGGASKRKSTEVEEPFDPNVEFVIPEKLKMLATDSEDIKAAKKKKVHALKSAYRLKKNEAEKAGRANSWKSFETAKPGKKMKGFMATTSKKKQSMFRTDEEGEGRVGVIGSHKKATEWKMFDVHTVKKAAHDNDDEDD